MNNIVSIITPLYNTEKYIEDTIKSVVSQTYSNWEMFIIDDCSTDDGPNIVKRYSLMDSRIKYIQMSTNSGGAVCRNRGIEVAQGKYISFLDSDDIWYSTKLEQQLKFMEKNNINFSYTNYDKISEDGEFQKKMYSPKRISYRKLLTTNYLGCLTTMYNQEKLGKIYMPIIRKRQDYALWLQILKKEKYGHLVPEVLGGYRVRKGSVSANKVEMVKWNYRLFRDIEKMPIYKCMFYVFLNIIIKVLIKR